MPIDTAIKGKPPTKINVSSGAGVPGGFDGGSLKSPTAEVNRLTAQSKAIDAKKLQLNTALAKGDPRVSPNDIQKLDNMKAATTTKLNTASKVPDFTSPVKLPSPPREPEVPDFSASGLPDVSVGTPGFPAIPETPDVPATSTTVTNQGGTTITSPPPEPPSPTKISAEAAANARNYANKAPTPRAKNAANSAQNQANVAKSYENGYKSANEQAQSLEDQQAEKDKPLLAVGALPTVGSPLTAKAKVLRQQAKEYLRLANEAANLSKQFENMAKSESERYLSLTPAQQRATLTTKR